MIKTIGTTITAPRIINPLEVYKSSSINVTNENAATVVIRFTPTQDILPNRGLDFTIEGSHGGANSWFTLQKVTSSVSRPNVLIPVFGVSGVSVTSATNNNGLIAGASIFARHATLNLSEFNTVVAVGEPTFDVLNPFVNNQVGSNITDNAEFFTIQLDLISVSSIRLVAGGSGTNTVNIFEAYLNLGRI